MYLSHITSICCIHLLVIKSTSWNYLQQKVVDSTAKIFAMQDGILSQKIKRAGWNFLQKVKQNFLQKVKQAG